MNRATLLLPLVSAFYIASAMAVSNDGWIEIGPSATGQDRTDSSLALSAPGVSGAKGDKLHVVRSGESLVSIAKTTTGIAGNASAIAVYNGIVGDNAPAVGDVLLVPLALLSENAASLGKGNRFMQEYPDPGLNKRHALDGQQDSSEQENKFKSVNERAKTADTQPAAADIVTQNLDMFAGEVKVLGKVAVTRVAVGNGAVVRAEVISSGELLLIAEKSGSTSLRLWHSDESQSDYNIRVGATDPETRFHMERMVRMKVRMVEFRKSALGRLGIDWSDSTAGPTFATAGDLVTNSLFRPASDGFAAGLPNAVKPFSTYFGVASNITSRINFLASSGDAVILAEPVLSSVNGGSANFLAGGEVPYPTVGSSGQSIVQFKEYGIKLNISPQIDVAGNVRTQIDTEISQIDPAVSVNGAPGLLTRRTQTQLNVRSGETIVISGLLTAENSADIDSLPGIGKIPVLGALFRSKNVRNSVSELVIFVTPEVVDPAANTLTAASQKILSESSERVARARNSLQLLE